jgi:hypothetical protein
MAVSISVPIAVAIPDEGLHMAEELSPGDFSPASRDTLRRIIAGAIDASTTLAGGAPVDSPARLVEWIAEQVHAGE